MRLTLDELPRYLIERRLITPAALIREEIRLSDYSRRNRVFKVVEHEERGLLVKQPGEERPDHKVGISRESAICEAIAREPTLEELRWFLPTWRHFDPDNVVLITELVHPAATLMQLHVNAGDPSFSSDATGTIGRQLAALHARAGDALRPVLPDATTYTLNASINFGVGSAAQLTPANAEMLGTVRAKTDLYARAGETARRWACIAPIHGDIRWDNFLITTDRGPDGNANIRLIDWELAIWGDAAWDVACFLADYVRFRALNSSYHMGREVKARQRFAPDPSIIVPCREEEFLPSAGSFWRAYTRTADLDAAARKAMWEKVLAYLPYTLIRVMIEQGVGQSSLSSACKVSMSYVLESASSAPALARRIFGIVDGKVAR